MANRYWVAGTGSWDGTAGLKWASTSGGIGGESVPTSSDDVFFDASSGNGTVTISSGNTGCKHFNSTGYTGTISGTDGISISGDLIVGSGVTWSYGGGLQFIGTGSINTNGVSLSGNYLNINTTGTINLSSNISVAYTDFSAGTFNSNNYNITNNGGTNFISGTLNFGSSTYSASGLFGNSFSGTFNAGTSNFVITGSGGSLLFINTALIVFHTLTYTIGNSDGIFANSSGTLSVTNLNILTDGSSNPGTMLLIATAISVSGTLTITGSSEKPAIVGVHSGFQQIYGTQKTITAASVSLTRAYFYDINAAGAASPWTGTNIGDCGGNSNITFTTSTTQTWQGTTGGTWADSAKWTSRVPLPQDNVIINNAFVPAESILVNCAFLGNNVDFSGSTNAPTFFISGVSSAKIFGNLTITSNLITLSTGNVVLFEGRNKTSTFTFNGGLFEMGVTVRTHNGTVQLADNANFGSNALSVVSLVTGTFDANNKDIILPKFTSLAGKTRTLLMGSGTWTLSTTSVSWDVVNDSLLTISPSTSTIKCIVDEFFGKEFKGGGFTYNNFWVSGSYSQETTITGSNTFNNFKVDRGCVVAFTAGTTTTISSLTTYGSFGNLVTLKSVTNNSAWTILKTSGFVIQGYLSLRDSIATGGATFYAGTTSTNVSGNTGWIFTAGPASTITGISSITGLQTINI